MDVRISWADPATRSLAQKADSVVKLHQVGLLPASFALKRLGYSESEIEEIRVARQAETLDAATADVQARADLATKLQADSGLSAPAALATAGLFAATESRSDNLGRRTASTASGRREAPRSALRRVRRAGDPRDRPLRPQPPPPRGRRRPQGGCLIMAITLPTGEPATYTARALWETLDLARTAPQAAPHGAACSRLGGAELLEPPPVLQRGPAAPGVDQALLLPPAHHA